MDEKRFSSVRFFGGPIRSNRMRAIASGCRAFSLVEILVVMAIIGIIVAFATPLISSIGASRGVSQAAYDVSGLLEFARNEAVTRQTYVWVGLQPETTAAGANLRLGAVYSKDGSTSAAAGNLQPLTRALTVQRVALTDFRELDPGTQQILSNRGQQVSAEAKGNAGITFKIGGVDFGKADGATITFTPRGEAMLAGAPTAADGFDALIGVGLQKTRGSTTANNDPNDAGVVLDGSVGIPRIVRQL